MIRFPIDCPSDCPHLRWWDMSIDDYTYVCDALAWGIKALKEKIDGSGYHTDNH